MHMDRTMQAIYNHAAACYPQECCGVVTRAGVTVPLDNVAANPVTHFSISSRDNLMYVQGSLFIYHSHPDSKAVFSSADQKCFKSTRIPLMVVSWPQGEIRMLGDVGAADILEGRPFIYGAYDCYSLARDFYKRELDIHLPQITRPMIGWWAAGQADYLTEGIKHCNMVDCDSLEYGDVLLFALNGSKVANHIGIYMEGNRFMHHARLALSSVTEYDQH